MKFYYYDRAAGQPKLDVYDMDENFLIMFEDFGTDIFLPPKHGKKVATIDYKLPQPNRDEMERLLAKFEGRELPELVEEPTTESNSQKQVDTRTFWETYTPVNMYRELMSRISG